MVAKFSTGSESRSDESHSGLYSPTSRHTTRCKRWTFSFLLAYSLKMGTKFDSDMRLWSRMQAVAGDEDGGAGSTCLDGQQPY